MLPVECAGCGLLDVPLCEGCAAALTTAPRRCEGAAPRLDRVDGSAPLPVWAVTPYVGPVRELVVAWKDRGRADLDRALHESVRRAGAVLGARLVTAARLLSGPEAPARLVVVPAPSTGAARRARGRDPVLDLARAFGAGVASADPPEGVDVGAPVDLSVASVLTQRRRTRDQVGLGSRARGGRLEGAVTSRERAVRRLLVRGTSCVVVDDVLTTGATLAACETVLREHGASVLGAFVLAATPPPAGFGGTPGAHRGLVLPTPPAGG